MKTGPHLRSFHLQATRILAGSISALLTWAIPPARLQAATLVASGGANLDFFGYAVGVSGSTGLVGAYNEGAAYVFRNLDTATGSITESLKLIASDGAAGDAFGAAVSGSGSIGLVGAYGNNSYRGAAYVFRSLDTSVGAISQSVKLLASDGLAFDYFGLAVSLSGSIGLVGAYGADIDGKADQGSAYVFRDLDTAAGTITQNVKLTASDGAAGDQFGIAVSESGSIGLVGASKDDIGFNDQGAAYVFRDLDVVSGTITQNVKLTASDGAENDQFGYSVSLSGSIGLVGALTDEIVFSNQGSAYVFRGLDLATATITQNVKLTASDGAQGDLFGNSVSLSGSVGLVGAYHKNSNQGAAYVFRALDTATGTITQSVKLTASGGLAGDYFGAAVSLSGDQFVIGANGRNNYTGKAYSGSVSSVTTLNTGSTSRTIYGISFVSQDDWIIGETTDANQVTLSAGDAANVTAAGKGVYIGKSSGSDNNTLIIAGTLTANTIVVGAAGNTGNLLKVDNDGGASAGKITGSNAADSITVNNGGTLLLAGAGNNDRIANTTGVTLAGGTLGLAAGVSVSEGVGAVNNNGSISGTSSVGLGVLTLSANSTLDFGTGGVGTLVFTTFAPGVSTLNVLNYTSNASGYNLNQSGISGTDDRLIFNQNVGAAGYLGRITFNGTGAAQIALDGGFYEIVAVPEPATIFSALALLGLVGYRERRRLLAALRS